MNRQQEVDYQRIERAIRYINEHRLEQPALREIAEHVGMSPHHFQRLFTQWAGVSPKKFMQFLTLEHARVLLGKGGMSVQDAALETGLSGTSRLHDLFVRIEGMTPGEYRSGGENLTINYSFAGSPFGRLIVASTPKGVCHMSFAEDEHRAVRDLSARFPNASCRRDTDKFQQDALSVFRKDWRRLDDIRLHLSGTPFQLKVWETLLTIPCGSLSTYGEVATEVGSPKSARAVANAIGANPVAVLIPCHRVIRSTGQLGGYMWGTTRKAAIIGWESGRLCE